jgi:hypothetical protein
LISHHSSRFAVLTMNADSFQSFDDPEVSESQIEDDLIWIVGAEGSEDPESRCLVGQGSLAKPSQITDKFLVLSPGEEPWFSPEFPNRKGLKVGIVVCAEQVTFVSQRRRTPFQSPVSAVDNDSQVASRVVNIFIRNRLSGVTTRPRKYLVA